MNRLQDEGYDVWAFANNKQGYGFNLILKEKSKFIHVHISYMGEDEDNIYYISSHEMKGNVLDTICCRQLGSSQTTESDEVYKLVKSLI